MGHTIHTLKSGAYYGFILVLALVYSFTLFKSQPHILLKITDEANKFRPPSDATTGPKLDYPIKIEDNDEYCRQLYRELVDLLPTIQCPPLEGVTEVTNDFSKDDDDLPPPEDIAEVIRRRARGLGQNQYVFQHSSLLIWEVI